MPKFIIKWDAGFGPCARVITAKDKDEADEFAYEAWKEDAESQADYSSEPYSKERAEYLQADDDT